MISIIVTLIIIGLILWLVESVLPIDGWIKQVIRVVVIICVVLYLLNMFGLMTNDVPVVHLR